MRIVDEIKIGVNDASLTPEEALELVEQVGWKGYTADHFRRALPRTQLVVTARAGGRLVGMARAFGDGAVYAAIVDVVVRPGFQKCGIGTRMMDLLMAELKALDLHRIYLRAAPGTLEWYERFGFKAAYGGTVGMSYLGW